MYDIILTIIKLVQKMALAGVCRTSQILRTFHFSKSPINVLTELLNKNVILVLSRNIVCNKYLYSKNEFEPVRKSKSKSNNPDSAEQPRQKSSTSPRITLISSGNDVTVTTLEQAEKLADRRNLKLVKIVDFDTKSKKSVFKLMTAQEFFEEDSKTKEKKRKERDSALKEDKLFTISTKISEHDLNVKINQIIKLLKKRHEIRVFISKAGNQARALELAAIIENEIKDLINSKTSISKGNILKMSYVPKIESANANNKENNEPESQQEDKPEEMENKLGKG